MEGCPPCLPACVSPISAAKCSDITATRSRRTCPAWRARLREAGGAQPEPTRQQAGAHARTSVCLSVRPAGAAAWGRRSLPPPRPQLHPSFVRTGISSRHPAAIPVCLVAVAARGCCSCIPSPEPRGPAVPVPHPARRCGHQHPTPGQGARPAAPTWRRRRRRAALAAAGGRGLGRAEPGAEGSLPRCRPRRRLWPHWGRLRQDPAVRSGSQWQVILGAGAGAGAALRARLCPRAPAAASSWLRPTQREAGHAGSATPAPASPSASRRGASLPPSRALARAVLGAANPGDEALRGRAASPAPGERLRLCRGLPGARVRPAAGTAPTPRAGKAWSSGSQAGQRGILARVPCGVSTARRANVIHKMNLEISNRNPQLCPEFCATEKLLPYFSIVQQKKVKA